MTKNEDRINKLFKELVPDTGKADSLAGELVRAMSRIGYRFYNETKNEDRINKLFKELVPDTGKADSLAGELVRAMSRIGYRFYNDGDQLGIGYGKETCNTAGRFLGAKGNDKIAKLTADAWAVYSEEAYEKVLDILCGAVAAYVEQNPDLRNQPTEDMWDFKDEEEDQDDSWDEEDDWGEEDY